MNDPTIDAVLCTLLFRYSFVTIEQVCWWDGARGEAAIIRAGMVRISKSAAFTTTEATADWMQETWDAIRAARPTDDADNFCREDVETADESPPAQVPAGTPQEDHEATPMRKTT